MPTHKKKNHKTSLDISKSKKRHSRQKCERKSKEKCERKSKEKCERKSRDHDSESSCDEEEDFEDIYCQLKDMLLLDDQLMVSGSDVYFDGYSTQPKVLQANGICPFDFISLQKNADYPYTNSPIFIREDGVYLVLFTANTAQSSQFSIFVNNIPQYINISGNNAGSGQTVCNFSLKLKKNDNIALRNYKSETASLNIISKVGGLKENSNINIVVQKISSLYENKLEHHSKCEFTRKEKCLFKKLEHKLLCDPCLQMKGYNVHGSFTSFTSQTVALEAPVVFTNGNNVCGLTPIDGTGSYSQIRIEEDGVYRIEFLCTTDTSAQFALFLNGTVMQSCIFGSNKGAGQIIIRNLSEFKKGDLLSVNNHTSGSSIVLSQGAGGELLGLSAVLQIVKISSLGCVSNNKKKHCVEKMYCNFKKFLLMNKNLQLTGSDAYITSISNTPQVIQVGEKLILSTIDIVKNITFVPGTSDFIIEQKGDYEIRGDIICDRPSQFTVFVNNVAVANTTTGRDSGANRNIIRQIVTLKKGDVVDIRNWKTNLGEISTTQNSGGTFVDISSSFVLIKLSKPCDMYHKFKC
jgi:hypothetical protein